MRRSLRVYIAWNIYQWLLPLIIIVAEVVSEVPDSLGHIITLLSILNLPFLKLSDYSDGIMGVVNGICFILIAIFGSNLTTGWMIFFYIFGGIRILLFLVLFIIGGIKEVRRQKYNF